MGKTTVQVLPTTSYGTATGNYLGAAADFVSDNVKGDGYYGFADGILGYDGVETLEKIRVGKKIK